MPSPAVLPDPGAGMDPATMPAHWLLAQLGKKVMRPGGGALGDVLLAGLAITSDDDVLDLAPGLGTTVRQVQALAPHSFRGIERSEVEAERSRRQVTELPYTCVVAHPAETSLPDGSMSVIYGEACLSLETDASKERIVAEAARLLRPGGRLGLHELLLTPEDISAEEKRRVAVDISKSVRVGARPLTRAEWSALLETAGFEVRLVHPAKMLLLDPRCMLKDEGVGGTLRLLGRILRSRVVTRRMVHLWRTMHRDRRHLGSVAIVAVRR